MLDLLSKLLDRPTAPAQRTRTPGAQEEPTGTRLASSPARVRDFFANEGAKRVLLHADRNAFTAAQSAFGGLDCVWTSNEIDWRRYFLRYAANRVWIACANC